MTLLSCLRETEADSTCCWSSKSWIDIAPALMLLRIAPFGYYNISTIFQSIAPFQFSRYRLSSKTKCRVSSFDVPLNRVLPSLVEYVSIYQYDFPPLPPLEITVGSVHFGA
jgi:hypothetical protein